MATTPRFHPARSAAPSREELMREVRRLEIATRHAVTEVFAGEYSSALKGRGIEFDQVREYEPGDDTRSIDWNVTARAGRPFIKRYVEERELAVVLAVDASASGDFGTVGRAKIDLAAEVCALLAFAATRKNDKVGLLLFTDRVERYIPPRKGVRHALRVVREVLGFRAESGGTGVRSAVEHLARVLHRRSVVFLLSDFISPPFDRALATLARRHDTIAVSITDPREETLPPTGLINLADAETGRRVLVDASSRRVRTAFERAAERRRGELAALFRRSRVDHLALSTGSAYAHALAAFFRAREKRR